LKRRSALAATVMLVVCALGCDRSAQTVTDRAAALRPILLQRVATTRMRRDRSAQTDRNDFRNLLADLEIQQQDFTIPTLAIESAVVLSGPDDPATAGPADSETPSAAVGPWWQKPLAGRSFSEVAKDDLKQMPREFWKATKDTVNPPALLLLAGAGGLSAISHGSWDDRVDRSFCRHSGDNIFHKEGDFSSVIGNPTLHFGLAFAAYGLSVKAGNDKVYGFSKSMIQALALSGATDTALKLAANNYSPNGEYGAWPSGHASSTATVAAVAWEYYGWPAGVPLYLLTGWVSAGRLDDREHWLSDVIFGSVLGAVVGHSVARGRMVEVGGFTVLPYADPEGGGGIMFVKQF